MAQKTRPSHPDRVALKPQGAASGSGIGGGTVSTAGNLVFQVTNQGRLIAYSADKGEKLLDINTGLRGGMAPPITYQIDGKQYVALMGAPGIVAGRAAAPLDLLRHPQREREPDEALLRARPRSCPSC